MNKDITVKRFKTNGKPKKTIQKHLTDADFLAVYDAIRNSTTHPTTRKPNNGQFGTDTYRIT